jgi:hypothetical protein
MGNGNGDWLAVLKPDVGAKQVFPELREVAQNGVIVFAEPQGSGQLKLPGLTGKVGRHVLHEAKGNSGTAAGGSRLWSVSQCA